MDIGAYARIEDLSAILASTGINIPRLRGLRLMATEEKISEDEIKEMADSAEVDAVEDLVRACPPWSVGSSCHSYCNRTDKNLKRFLVYTEDERGYKQPTAVRWNELHGKKRKLSCLPKHRQKESGNLWKLSINMPAERMYYMYMPGLVEITGYILTVHRLQSTRLSLKEWMTGSIQHIVISTLKLTSLLWSSI